MTKRILELSARSRDIPERVQCFLKNLNRKDADEGRKEGRRDGQKDKEVTNVFHTRSFPHLNGRRGMETCFFHF